MSGAWNKSPARRKAYLEEMAREADFKPGKLAELCDISLRQLERYCLEDFGCHPRDWLTRLRLVNARELLMEHGHVGRVARKLAYHFPTNFTRDFQRVYQMTPSEFLRSADLQRDVES